MLFSSLTTKCSTDLRFVCSPSDSFFNDHFNYFCQNSGLLGNSRIESKHFSTLFNMLIYIRLYPNSSIAKEMITFLKVLKIPTGFMKAVKFLPIAGIFRNVKGFTVNVVLETDFKELIESNCINNKSYGYATFLSKELSSSRSGNFESFDEVSILSGTQNFILNSFLDDEFRSESLHCSMHCNDINPEINVGMAVTLIFGLSSTSETFVSLSALVGSVANIEMSRSQYLGNCHSSIDLLFNDRQIGNVKTGIKTKNHKASDSAKSSRNDKKDNVSPSTNVDTSNVFLNTLAVIISESVISILAKKGLINNGSINNDEIVSDINYPLAL